MSSLESGRFVWKRNIKYDLILLSEVNARNPYAFNNQKPIWIDVAKCLQESELKMKVTDRSCRERVVELLKNHRKKELKSIRVSGISKDDMEELNVLLTGVDQLEATKPNKQLKSTYSRKDREIAEAIRSEALQEALNSENPLIREQANEEVEMREYDRSCTDDKNRKRNSETITDVGEKDDESEDDFEFDAKKGRYEHPSNPKTDLVKYLEDKSKKEIDLRREELRIREREVENKVKELEIMRIKAESEAAERKIMSDVVMKLLAKRD